MIETVWICDAHGITVTTKGQCCKEAEDTGWFEDAPVVQINNYHNKEVNTYVQTRKV